MKIRIDIQYINSDLVGCNSGNRCCNVTQTKINDCLPDKRRKLTLNGEGDVFREFGRRARRMFHPILRGGFSFKQQKDTLVAIVCNWLLRLGGVLVINQLYIFQQHRAESLFFFSFKKAGPLLSII